ncbi:hypothetical protein RND81_02G137100 [Saponaria officinalis]|uniref:VQ domain-containing protein n=1 Tax=Saponaria officinalis TaxID=3572 RepID=A0AAW1MQD5_SAPOF
MVAYSSSEEMKHQYDLNSLQKSSRIIKKPPTAAATTTTTANGQQQPKVYKVQPIHFRELVQKLTGAQPGGAVQQSQPRRQSTLQRVAPPPLPINPHYLQLQTQAQAQTRVAEKQVSCNVEQNTTLDKREAWEGLTELTLSPNFQAWFNFAMLSPGPAPVSH